MSNTAANAIAGKPKVTGGILTAPLGTALPTNETSNPNAAFKSTGYLTDAGFTRSEKLDSEVKKAWGGDPLIEIDKGGPEATAKFGFAEYLNEIVQQLIYGEDNVTVTPATNSAGRKLAIVGKIALTPQRVWIVELFSGEATGRIVFPKARIVEREDVTYKDDDIAARGVTLRLWPDENGAYFYEYWDDGRKVLGSGSGGSGS